MGAATSTYTTVRAALPDSIEGWLALGPPAIARSLHTLSKETGLSREERSSLATLAARIRAVRVPDQPDATPFHSGASTLLVSGAEVLLEHTHELFNSRTDLSLFRRLLFSQLTSLPPRLSLSADHASAILSAFCAADVKGRGWLGSEQVERLVSKRFPDAQDSVWLTLLPMVCGRIAQKLPACAENVMRYELSPEEFVLCVDVLCCMSRRQLVEFAFLCFCDPSIGSASPGGSPPSSSGSPDSSSGSSVGWGGLHAVDPAIRLSRLLRPNVQPLLAEAAADLDGRGHVLGTLGPATHANAALVDLLRWCVAATITRFRMQGRPEVLEVRAGWPPRHASERHTKRRATQFNIDDDRRSPGSRDASSPSFSPSAGLQLHCSRTENPYAKNNTAAYAHDDIVDGSDRLYSIAGGGKLAAEEYRRAIDVKRMRVYGGLLNRRHDDNLKSPSAPESSISSARGPGGHSSRTGGANSGYSVGGEEAGEDDGFVRFDDTHLPAPDAKAADIILLEDWLSLAASSPYAFHGLFAFRDALAAATGGEKCWEKRREAFQSLRAQLRGINASADSYHQQTTTSPGRRARRGGGAAAVEPAELSSQVEAMHMETRVWSATLTAALQHLSWEARTAMKLQGLYS